MRMSLEILLLIVFGVLTSFFALFQLCITLHKYCVWCRESQLNLNRQAEVLNLESIDQGGPSQPSSNDIQPVSSSSESQLNSNRQTEVFNLESIDREGPSQHSSKDIQAVSSSESQLDLNRQAEVFNLESIDREGPSQPSSNDHQTVSSSEESFVSCLESV